MLHPFRCLLAPARCGLVRQLVKGQRIAPAAIEEPMHVGIMFAVRGDMVLGESEGPSWYLRNGKLPDTTKIP